MRRALRNVTLAALTLFLLVWINRPASDDFNPYVSEIVNVVRRGWDSHPADDEVQPAQPAPNGKEKDEISVEDKESNEGEVDNDPHTPVPFCTNEDRIAYLEQHCGGSIGSIRDLNDRALQPLWTNMFVDTKHKLLACLPPKSGCTTWKNILANNSQDEPLPRDFKMMSLHFGDLPKYGIQTMYAYNTTMKQYFLDNYFKMMIARHPLERFRSAYIDKLESGSDRYMQVQYGKPILQKFHPEYSESRINDAKGVTLSEFARYIQMTGAMNPHWKPVSDLCLPCLIKYDRILKTETLDHDNEYVIMNHMAPHFRGLGTKGNIVAGGSQADSLSKHGRLLDRYDNVTLSDLSFLEKFYEKDFKNFGYSWSYNKDTEGMQHAFSSCVSGGLNGACC